MANLVQEFKKFREKEKDADDIIFHSVDWDVDPTLIGEPINDKTIVKLSTHVDKKLKEYSRIYATNAATQDNSFAKAINPQPVVSKVFSSHTVDVLDEVETDELNEAETDEHISHTQALVNQTEIVRSTTVTLPVANHESYMGRLESPSTVLEDGFQRPNPFTELYRLPVGTTEPDEEDLVQADNTHYHPDFERGQVVMRLPIFQSHEEKMHRDSVMVAQDDKELHISNDLERLSKRWSGYYPNDIAHDKTSYITSYTVSIVNGIARIQANIITAPAKSSIDDSIWFSYCTSDEANDGQTYSQRHLRSLIKSNLLILAKTRAQSVDVKPSELVALETLREIVTEEDFRHYLRYGFINVRGASGRIYQIFRSRRHTKVWKDGALIEEVCVQIKDSNIPISDQVIALKTMIETSEDLFRQNGNVYKMNKKVA